MQSPNASTSHVFDTPSDIHRENEAGFWSSLVKERPSHLRPGILQGTDIEKITRTWQRGNRNT